MKFNLADWITSEATTVIFAGAAGGLVRWITLRSDWREGLGAVVVGAICALYLSPLVVPLLEPVIGRIAPDNDASGFSAFVVGLGGIALSGFIIEVIQKRRKELDDDARDNS